MRSHYWTCSKFADWLRGTPKGNAKTGEDWNLWTKTAKATYPVRFWLAEEGLDHAQKFFYGPVDLLYSIKYYVNNRWVSRSHSLTANPKDIKPGDWCDVSHRFLFCMFNELQDFVEIELAWSNIAWDSSGKAAKYNPPFWSKGWFRWRTWRCPEAGLDYLAWASSLTFNEDWIEPTDPKWGKPTPQAEGAIEIKALYDWWTTVYRNRPDPHEASGWSALCEARREKAKAAGEEDNIFAGFNERTPAERKESLKILKLCRKIEEAYEKEDEQMMIRLIKVRNNLWT